jgi:hypothetical protein
MERFSVKRDYYNSKVKKLFVLIPALMSVSLSHAMNRGSGSNQQNLRKRLLLDIIDSCRGVVSSGFASREEWRAWQEEKAHAMQKLLQGADSYALTSENSSKTQEAELTGIALGEAVMLGLERIVELLLQYGADPDTLIRIKPTWRAGRHEPGAIGTVLHEALRLGLESVVEVLLRHGADPNYQPNATEDLPFLQPLRSQNFYGVNKLLVFYGYPYILLEIGEDYKLIRRSLLQDLRNGRITGYLIREMNKELKEDLVLLPRDRKDFTEELSEGLLLASVRGNEDIVKLLVSDKGVEISPEVMRRLELITRHRRAWYLQERYSRILRFLLPIIYDHVTAAFDDKNYLFHLPKELLLELKKFFLLSYSFRRLH